jgi:tetratricopeptide (TPR) repeat protein
VANSTAPGTAGEPTTLDPGTAPATPTEAAATAGADGGAAAAATAGDTAAPAEGGDKTKLLADAKSKKTSDAKAKKALEDAEAAGATVRELAEASNERGVALLGAGEPERATAAFEWARDKDPTYPDPSFNLAKQTAMAGEIPETVKHLQEVHKRGGKKLLKQVGFDPTFEIVKDDPDVQKIIK